MCAAISVIVISYNDEKHLPGCIESLKAQTLRDFEVILVDDGSTDATGRLMDEAAATDPRFRVMHQPKNMGMAAARYAGFLASTSQLVTFVDSDDRLTENACERMCTLMEQASCDVLEMGVICVPDAEFTPDPQVLRAQQAYFDSPAARLVRTRPLTLLHACFDEKTFSWNAHHKVYKHEVLKDAHRFYQNEYVNMAEDVVLSFMVCCSANTYAVVKEKAYLYSFGAGMSTQRQGAPARIRKIIPDYLTTIRLLHDWSAQLSLPPEAEVLIQRIEYSFLDTVFDTLARVCTTEQRTEIMPLLIDAYTSEKLLHCSLHYIDSTLLPSLQQTEDCLKATQDYAEALKHSPTWHIGSVVTAVPRKLGKLLKRADP